MLIYFERPDLLADADRDMMAAELRRRLVGEGHDAPPWLTVEKALAELDEALAKVGVDAPALVGYREHLEGLSSDEGFEIVGEDDRANASVEVAGDGE
ncbi:MAG: hypothetical protein KA085_08710 [Phenylobacterium sp.]|nr:hypothetical protein [Phenylobacterium sp.]MBP7816192.1 hypothetical protein [Phenylobacterium sp.]